MNNAMLTALKSLRGSSLETPGEETTEDYIRRLENRVKELEALAGNGGGGPEKIVAAIEQLPHVSPSPS